MSEGKVSPGQDFAPPPATVWNNMVDAGRAWADDRLNRGAGDRNRPRETDLIKIKNSSGAVRRRGEILKIDGKAIEEITDENVWLVGTVPTEACRFGILKDPADTNAVERLQVSGVVGVAMVNITDESHTSAEAADGEYVLQSGTTGSIEILYAPPGTGEKECVVRFAGGSGSSAGNNAPCPCNCLETGDILVNGIETTSRWRVSLPIVKFDQANGEIRLAAGDYLLEWDSGVSMWVLDIGDSLTAVYNDGTDATADTTMDGEITLEWASLTDQPELKVCVTGTVPVP